MVKLFPHCYLRRLSTLHTAGQVQVCDSKDTVDIWQPLRPNIVTETPATWSKAKEMEVKT